MTNKAKGMNMKIVTYEDADRHPDGSTAGYTLKAATIEEFEAMSQAERDNWDEWVWQDQPSKEAALARHVAAFDAWQADNEAGRPFKDTY